LLLRAAPDFLEHNRREARDGVLLTTTVDVPHAGLPWLSTRPTAEGAQKFTFTN
jgi:hypothetical protein